MNWLYLILGIPAGTLVFSLGELLEKRYRGKSNALRGLLLGTPFAILCVIIIILGWQ